MKNKLKINAIILLCFVICICSIFQIFSSDGFKYIHDPKLNPKAMKDIEENPSAVYGFKPSSSGSLKNYADLDWSDTDFVENGRNERIEYHKSIKSMYTMLDDMKKEGKTIEEIARTLSAKRNQIRLDSYVDDPEGLAIAKQHNLENYGHEEGPLPDELYAKYGSWNTVLEKAFSVNIGMDVCLGLYDDYYSFYQNIEEVESGENVNKANIDRIIKPLVITGIIVIIAAALVIVVIVIIRKKKKDSAKNTIIN